MSRIFWDTNLFIYLVEDHPELAGPVVQLRTRMVARRDALITSTLTLGELLVKPLEASSGAMVQAYETLLREGAELIAFDAGAARRYAAIRANRAMRPPDAVQLACAAEASADLFITNDERLAGMIVPGVPFITSLRNAPL